MNKKHFVWMIFLVLVLSCISTSSVNAKTFKIGSKLPEGDINLYLYTSGAVIGCDAVYKDYAPLIFDGNESTGVNNSIGSGIDWNLWLSFPNPINVSTITAKPTFGGGSGKYVIQVAYKDNWAPVCSYVNGERTFNINCTIETLYLTIVKNGTNDFYFNDIIINYTPVITEENPKDYQPQIDKINKKLDLIQYDFNTLELAFENFTNIEPSEYNDSELRNELQNQINLLSGKVISLEKNLSEIDKKIPAEYNDSGIKGLINDLDYEINNLKEDLKSINESIPMAYDDSALRSNIFKLESEDITIIQKIGNLTFKIENLTIELEKLSSEVQKIQSLGSSRESNNEPENRFNQYGYSIIFGIILIVLLLIILRLSIIVLKNKSQQISSPSSENGVYSNVMHDILFNSQQHDINGSNNELNTALDNKYRNGDMSAETYNSLKNLIQNLEHAREMKK